MIAIDRLPGLLEFGDPPREFRARAATALRRFQNADAEVFSNEFQFVRRQPAHKPASPGAQRGVGTGDKRGDQILTLGNHIKGRQLCRIIAKTNTACKGGPFHSTGRGASLNAMPDQLALRDHLLELLRGGQAHVSLEDAVKGFPLDLIGIRPDGAPHSAWELLEHIRIALDDIVRFSQSADYQSPPWPKGYWPSAPAPKNESEWHNCLRLIRESMASFETLLRDPEQNLFRKLPWGEGQTLLREALLIADHNAYHLGQLVLVRRLLGSWE